MTMTRLEMNLDLEKALVNAVHAHAQLRSFEDFPVQVRRTVLLCLSWLRLHMAMLFLLAIMAVIINR